MSVVHAIVWVFETLLQLLLPPAGRHRAADSADGRRRAVQHQHTPTMARPARVPDAPARPMAAEFRPACGLPDGHWADMVRPYVVAHEQRQERAEHRLRRQRRRTLWLAVHGIDIGPRVIHGVRVVA